MDDGNVISIGMRGSVGSNVNWAISVRSFGMGSKVFCLFVLNFGCFNGCNCSIGVHLERWVVGSGQNGGNGCYKEDLKEERKNEFTE